MKQIIKTTLLEYEKSAFLINLVQHESDKIYVGIQQTIKTDTKTPIQQEIKINPSVLSDIIDVLVNYQIQLSKKKPKSLLTELQKEQIQKRYFKGISIADLTLQFDCPEALIEQVLRNKGIEILSKKEMNPPKEYWRRRRKR